MSKPLILLLTLAAVILGMVIWLRPWLWFVAFIAAMIALRVVRQAGGVW